jgi:hypothetical protein
MTALTSRTVAEHPRLRRGGDPDHWWARWASSRIKNPVHSALSLIMTLFGVAVAFVAQQADFLAAVQIIVYAGAIVVLFLFVIMFLGVDRREHVHVEPSSPSAARRPWGP